MAQRFFHQEYYDVITVNKLYNDEKKIGQYKIPDDAKTKVKQILELLEKPYYNSEIGTILIIELYHFKINEQNIEFLGSPAEIQKNKQDLFNKNHYFTFLKERPINIKKTTQQSLSDGYYLAGYVVDNTLRTIKLNKLSNPSLLIDGMKRRFPGYQVVHLSDPISQLDTYLDTEKYKAHQDSIPKEQPAPEPEQLPTEPQMTEKQLKLQAYNMRRAKELEKQQHLWKYKKR